jgi:hypothetical protein
MSQSTTTNEPLRRPIPDIVLGLRRHKTPKVRLYVVSFADGNGLRIDRNVVAQNRLQARALATPTVPASLYGPDLVFLRARVSKNLPLTIDSECLQLLTEKTGVSL